MENLGKEEAVIKTVFAYKVNVAIAAILLFVNVQVFASILAATNQPVPIITSFLLCAASLVYGLLSVNGYLTKIIVYEDGFVIKKIFRKIIVRESEIKKAAFRRVNLKKVEINVSVCDGRNIKINSAKYNGITPLIKYLAKFK